MFQPISGTRTWEKPFGQDETGSYCEKNFNIDFLQSWILEIRLPGVSNYFVFQHLPDFFLWFEQDDLLRDENKFFPLTGSFYGVLFLLLFTFPALGNSLLCRSTLFWLLLQSFESFFTPVLSWEWIHAINYYCTYFLPKFTDCYELLIYELRRSNVGCG